jgi:DNA-binding MarR family transcriptional regulator
MADDLGVAIAVRELVLSAERFRAARAEAALGVSSTEMVALGILQIDGPQTPTELAKRLGIASASSTELCDRLEGVGLIRRRPHTTDRRKRVIVLAPRAEKAVRKIYRELGNVIGTAMKEAYADEIIAFLQVAAAALTDAARLGLAPPRRVVPAGPTRIAAAKA